MQIDDFNQVFKIAKTKLKNLDLLFLFKIKTIK